MIVVLEGRLAGRHNVREESDLRHDLLVFLRSKQRLDGVCSEELKGGGQVLVLRIVHKRQKLEDRRYNT